MNDCGHVTPLLTELWDTKEAFSKADCCLLKIISVSLPARSLYGSESAQACGTGASDSVSPASTRVPLTAREASISDNGGYKQALLN